MTQGATETTYDNGMRKLVITTCEANPRSSVEELYELVAVELTKAKWTHAEVFKYTACNLVNNYLRMGKVNTRGSIDHLKASIKNQMVLLGMICPNGKPLAFCTYGECLQFGGWYAKLAAGKDPALKVQETEEELRKLQTWQE